jgi:hypothetical protein
MKKVHQWIGDAMSSLLDSLQRQSAFTQQSASAWRNRVKFTQTRRRWVAWESHSASSHSCNAVSLCATISALVANKLDFGGNGGKEASAVYRSGALIACNQPPVAAGHLASGW